MTGLGNIFITTKMKYIIPKIKYLIVRLINANSNWLIFQNPDDKRYFKTICKYKFNKNTLITPGSGIKILKKNHKITNEVITFGMLSRIISGKGINEFLEAAKLIKLKYSNINFILAGPLNDNSFNLNSQDFIKKCKLSGVNYLGNLDDVEDFFNEIDIFVLPSYREGTPRSVLEAMLYKKPIITTKAIGCRETVINNYNGIKVKIKNVGELVNAIIFFVNNKNLIPQYGNNSYEYLIKKFDLKIVLNQYSKVLSHLNAK